MSSYLIAADTGGTFTDIAAFDASNQRVIHGKALTDYGHLADGALAALDATGVDVKEGLLFKHGTTHVINAFIQRNGAKTALICTRGFSDLIEIGRGNRPEPFSLRYRRDPALVPRNLRFEVSERMDGEGNVIAPLDVKELERLAIELREQNVIAVAVSFLNAYANDSHEQQAVKLLREWLPDCYVTCGTALTGEWFEYERTSTAVANAYVGARMRQYIEDFEGRLRERDFTGTFYMMGSNGGVLSTARAFAEPVALVESGPVGGCIGAAAYSKALGISNLIAFDMGGTTAKCALVLDGKFEVQPVYYVGGYDRGFPLRTPVLDIVEVGAGGGSIAWLDASGALNVGPRSAGSEPGPVGFMRGGTEPTVTDANLALGRISGGEFIGGQLRLDPDAAAAAIFEKVAVPLGYEGEEGVRIAAHGILDLATVSMANAVKEITIERGHDVRDFTLFVFGGSGPLFASVLARTLNVSAVIIPPHPGTFSCLGMLMAQARVDLARTVVGGLNIETLGEMERVFEELRVAGRHSVLNGLADSEVEYEDSLEMRYSGQKHTVRVPWQTGSKPEDLQEAFNESYRQRYGHTNSDCAIEIIGARLGAIAQVPKPSLEMLAPSEPDGIPEPTGMRSVYYGASDGLKEVPVWSRKTLPVGHCVEGPAVIEEYSSTTILLAGDIATVGSYGELKIQNPTEEKRL